MNDQRIRKIRNVTYETEQYFKECKLKNNKIYRKLDYDKETWVVPKLARMQICRLCHEDAGHLSTEKTLRPIQENYWFPEMRRFVTKYVNACLSCTYYKQSRSDKKQCKLNPIEKQPIPFHTIHIDHVGPFETSKSKNKFILVIVDDFTKSHLI